MLLRKENQNETWIAMTHDYIEDELSRRSVFKSEQFLSIDYVPENLPHRQSELRTLAQNFKTLITSPGRTSQRFIIEGPVGTGKTAAAGSRRKESTRNRISDY